MQLVILGSSITALAVARDARSHGLQPVVVDVQPGIAFRSRWVTPVRVAGVRADETLAAVRACATAGALLVATSDDWLRFVMAWRPALEATYAQVLHPANDMLRTFLHKHAFARWCDANGLPAPQSWMPDAAARPAALEFPLLMRPCETLHGHALPGLPKAIEVRSEPELQRWLARFRSQGVAPVVTASLLSQRLTQYSVPFARSPAGTLSFVARKLRPAPGRCAQGSLVEWCRDASASSIEQLARRGAECAGYHGIGEAEILHSRDSGKSYLIEINARPWLQYALAPATGHDLLGWMLDSGAKPRASPRAPRTWINLRDDRFNAMAGPPAGGLRGGLDVLAYLRSVARANVYAVFDPRDPMPFLHLLARRWP
jgi:predicted ATP-grasp superfamily ATP-dependent carboligase